MTTAVHKASLHKTHSIRARRRRALCYTGGTPGVHRFSYHLMAFSAAWRLLTRAIGA